MEEQQLGILTVRDALLALKLCVRSPERKCKKKDEHDLVNRREFLQEKYKSFLFRTVRVI